MTNRMTLKWIRMLRISMLFLALGFLVSCDGIQRQKALRTGDWVAHGFSAEKKEMLHSFVQDAVEAGDLAGCALLVIHEEEAIFREAFGFADLETRRPFTTEDVCVIASVAKPITATMMAMLDGEGVLSLEDPVERWIPEFQEIRLHDGSKSGRRPVVRQLLSHRSGLPGTSDLKGDKESVRESFDEVVAWEVSGGLFAEPGTRYSYGVAGYRTAGLIAERATGMTFKKLMEKRLFRPLGMRRTGFHPTEEELVHRPLAYGRMEGGFEYLSRPEIEASIANEASSSGALFSTLDDVGRFLCLHLNRGRIGGKQLIPAESLERMYVIPDDPPHPEYGLGWALGPQGPGQIRHSGGVGTFVWVDFEQEMAGVFLSQTRWAGNKAFQKRLFRTLRTAFENSAVDGADRADDKS